MKIIIVSGGFDPLHIGHINYLCSARELGDYLLVILNSDDFLSKKKGFIFMSLSERIEILKSLRYVDEVVKCIDIDDTVCESLRKVKETAGDVELIFAKGGDRTLENIPERAICEELGIEMLFHIGGDKVQSSSELARKLIERNKL